MRTVAGIAIGFTVAAVCGCGSLPLTGGFLSKSKKDAKDASRDVADAKPNPFRRSASGSAGPRSGREPWHDPELKDRTGVSASREDDTTRLKAEIADLPADKQQAILREWRQIDASMRPNFLRLIRSQRLLRGTKSASSERMTLEEYETHVANGDRDGFPSDRHREHGPVSPASRRNDRRSPRRKTGPFADDSQSDGTGQARGPDRGKFESGTAVRPNERDAGFDQGDVSDRFHSKDPAGYPDPSRPLDDRPGRIRHANSEVPLSGPPGDRPGDFEPRNAERTVAGRPFSIDGRRVPTSVELFSPEWDRTLQRLVELSDAEVAKQKTPSRDGDLGYLRRQVYLRMLYLLSGKTTQAVQAIPHVDAADQEFWQKTMWGISAYFDDRNESDRRSRATQTISRFNEAIEHLRAEADLVVKNVVFCRKIDSFGSYDKLAKSEFRPGEQVLVYAEIENFKTELTPEGHHRTRLKSEIELFQKVGSEYRESKQKYDFPPTEDVCRSYRRDYFHSYILTLPQSLGLGDYVLKLTVTDHVGNKIGSDTVQFTVK